LVDEREDARTRFRSRGHLEREGLYAALVLRGYEQVGYLCPLPAHQGRLLQRDDLWCGNRSQTHGALDVGIRCRRLHRTFDSDRTDGRLRDPWRRRHDDGRYFGDRAQPDHRDGEGQGGAACDHRGEVDSGDVAARALGNWFDSGRIAAEYLLDRHPEGSEPVKVLWMAGPEGPNWSVDSAGGFVKTIGDSSAIEIQKVIWGEPGKAAQISLIEDALQAYPDVDYIGGIAPAIEGAVQVVKEKGRDDIQLIASYMTPETLASLESGEVLGVVTDFTAAQAAIAIDQLVRILEGKEVDLDVDTGFAMLDAKTMDDYDRALSLAPVGWEPYFQVE
jgi:ABC-type sugar transport system, periplasmic component